MYSQLSGATGVVSCVGGFGSDEHMERLCGDATVIATEAAENVGCLLLHTKFDLAAEPTFCSDTLSPVL